ncbi:hypothetical protein MASR1M32_10770 [Rhodobacter sp.]
MNYSPAYSDTSASRLIVTATGETDRGALTSGLTDRNWLGRIEGVTYNLGQAGANNAALNFTGRKVIPWAIIPSSAANGQDLTITLSPSVLPGQDMIVSKQFAGGKVSITVPSGSNLFDRSHTKPPARPQSRSAAQWWIAGRCARSARPIG